MMDFVLYVEIGLALLTIGGVLFVLRLARRDKAAAADKFGKKQKSLLSHKLLKNKA